jgi:formylglycine-generating enzyme required for sulfatase activity
VTKHTIFAGESPLKRLAIITSVAMTLFSPMASASPKQPHKAEDSNPKAKLSQVTTSRTEDNPGMVYVEGKTYMRGNDLTPDNGVPYPEESPAHKVTVSSFWIDQHEVTNKKFSAFVAATGYVTFAEKPLSKDLFPQAPASQLVPGATVFVPPNRSIDPWRSGDPWQWWSYRAGASWKQPEGKGSSIEQRMDHPVVCVNIQDAKAYAQWAGKRLPTEAEWELAARGGKEEQMYTWGNQTKPDNRWLANCFQGEFPAKNTREDGFAATAPVGSFPPNDLGLYDMAANVWELCSDHYYPNYYKIFSHSPHPNPKGPKDPITMFELQFFSEHGYFKNHSAKNMPHLLHLYTMRGGSFLCHFDYCLRYRPASRHHFESLSPTNHVGFRCVKSDV